MNNDQEDPQSMERNSRQSSVDLHHFNVASGALIGLAIGDSIANGPDGKGSSQTQLCLVVSASLMRAWIRFAIGGKQPDLPSFTGDRIKRWAGEQGLRPPVRDDFNPISDWLDRQPAMERVEIVGNSIREALSDDRFPTMGATTSWGAACLPLAVTAGVAPDFSHGASKRSEMASAFVKLTHNDPVAVTSAGALAALLGEIIAGTGLEEAAIRIADDLKGPRVQFPETAAEAAKELGSKLSQAVGRTKGPGQYDKAGDLGGWDGHRADDALVISIWAALRSDGLDECIKRAQAGVNERNATSAIAASIWGASRAADATDAQPHHPGLRPGPPLPSDVFESEQLRRTRLALVAETVANDMCRIVGETRGVTPSDLARWPGW